MEVEEEPSIKTESSDLNPWSVDNASVFLKYCCPECDYNNVSLKVFSHHALENHAKSSTLFNRTNNDNDEILSKNKSEEVKIETDYYTEDYVSTDILENDFDTKMADDEVLEDTKIEHGKNNKYLV